MFRPFRARAGRTLPKAPPPPTKGDADAEYDRAWADYVEWSGLDEDRLPGGQGQPER